MVEGVILSHIPQLRFVSLITEILSRHTLKGAHYIPLIRAHGLVHLRYAFQTGNPKDIGYLLSLARSGQCKDPRDRVYAVLGLAENPVKKRIPIDYSKPTWWLYANVVNVYHNIYSRVDILYLSGLTAEPISPSWCLDLTPDRPFVAFDNPGYEATGEFHDCSAMFSRDLRCLYLDGFSVDVVGKTKPEETKSMLQDAHEELDWSRLVYNLVRILNISEKVRNPHKKATQESTKFHTYIEIVLQDILETINMMRADKRDRVDLDVPRTEGPAVLESGQRIRWRRSVDEIVLFRHTRACMENRTIIFSKNRRLGLAPGATRPGDHIFLLFGFKYPAILRPNPDGSWIFVGEAFVLGLMKGEAMIDYKRGIYKKQRLELR
jgi:hypothetical protein